MAIHEFDFEKEPTVSVVKRILNDAIKMKATDVHFDPTEDDLIIKFRINGNLEEYTTAPDSVKVNIITRVKILAGMNITESLMPQIGSLCIDSDGKSHTMRVSSLPIADGEKIVCHISNYSSSVKSIDKLGFNDKDVKKIRDILADEQGIVLVTGTGNSGKTTTIYSILKEINNNENNIISIEDPICLKIKGINQVELCPSKGITYKNVLKNILLQDPNVIAINELVDDEITRYALRASISGRLIISSLQCKTIYQTISNLLHMDVERYLLGSNLKGIISQRLVKRLCPMCREKRKATDYERSVIKAILGKDVKELYYPCGCDDCNDGYAGLISVAEVVKVDAELRHAIANGKSMDLIRKIIYADNTSILEDGLNKAINGVTSFQEIMRIMDLNEDFLEDDEEIKNLILGKDSFANDEIDKDDEKDDINNKIDVTDDEEINNSSEDETDEDKEEKEDEANNVDASVQMEDAKELLNRLMEKSKNNKKKDVKDEIVNTSDIDDKKDIEEKSNNEDSDGIDKDKKEIDEVKQDNKKKSSFNLNDIDVDDDEDFDYDGYDNTF